MPGELFHLLRVFYFVLLEISLGEGWKEFGGCGWGEVRGRGEGGGDERVIFCVIVLALE